MGKWLTIEEKLNAENELNNNVLIEKWLRSQIRIIQHRNNKLRNYLQHKKRKKRKEVFGINSVCYKTFGKKFRDLTVEERREYHRITKINREKKDG